jgi:hypothetical protein
MAVPKTWSASEVLTNTDLNASLASTAWTGVTYTNSWVDNGGGYGGVQYRKIGDIVYIRGAMKSGTITAAAFTLPAGFRPPTNLLFAAYSNSLFGAVDVASTGVVTPSVGSNVSFTVNLSFSVTT